MPNRKFYSSRERLEDIIDQAASEEPVRSMRGLKTAREALDLEDYPMSKSEIDYSVGDIEIEDGGGGFVPVRTLTDRLSQEEFNSAQEVIRALRDAAMRLSRDSMHKKVG